MSANLIGTAGFRLETQDDRPTSLIRDLGLTPHPEGGHYREIFRASGTVTPDDGRPARSALTTIYFLLRAGERSRWHRVASDEVWNFYEGSPLELYWTDGSGSVRVVTLAAGELPVCVIPAGYWQAARPLGAYTLVGCTVGPGFDFDDFELAEPGSAAWERLRALRGAPAELL